MTDELIVIGGLVLEGNHGTGIDLGALNRDVVLRDMVLTGYDVGISISWRCEACTITIQNTTIDAGTAGVRVNATGGQLALMGVDITTDGGGEVRPGPNGLPTAFGGSFGILLDEATGVSLSLSGVHISTREDSIHTAIGRAIRTTDLRLLSMEDVRISGHRSGVWVGAEDVRLKQVEIQCLAYGLAFWPDLRGGDVPTLRTWQRLQAIGLRITGCTDVALDVERFREVQLDDILLRGGTVGIAETANSFRISNFHISGMGRGITSFAQSGDSTIQLEASYQNGTVEDCRYTGIEAHHRTSLVDNVTFRNNGKHWPDPDDPAPNPSATLYGALVHYRGLMEEEVHQVQAVVRNSQFEGNAPFAVSGLNLVDARENWWGAADGPGVVYYDYMGLVPQFAVGGSGDHVNERVVIVPFLAAPP